MRKFNVDDIVIALPTASERYGITCEGWIGKVLKYEENNLMRAIEYDPETKQVFRGEDYLVEDKYFTLYEDPTFTE